MTADATGRRVGGGVARTPSGSRQGRSWAAESDDAVVGTVGRPVDAHATPGDVSAS